MTGIAGRICAECNRATETVRVRIPAHLSHTGKERWKDAEVDVCLVPIVSALQTAGIVMEASCCGHGLRPGNIALADGRELLVMPDFETARTIEALLTEHLYPVTINGEPVNPEKEDGA